MPTLLITGANRGIGLELSKQYLQDGWNVIACCRNPKKSLDLQALHAAHKDSCHVQELDVKDIASIKALSKTLQRESIDVLLNNAGVYGYDAVQFGDTDKDAWNEAVAVNVIAPMKMMEYFVQNVANSDKKIIASMSSKMGSMDDNTSGSSYAYRATKAALNAVMVSASHDLRHLDITSLILHPGWVRTDMGGPNGELSVEESATKLRQIINNASLNDSGSFFDIDGSIIPW